jgi:hypothetical protein
MRSITLKSLQALVASRSQHHQGRLDILATQAVLLGSIEG